MRAEGDREILSALEERLGYRFRNPRYLERALRHGSSGGPSYQRLEFLGDAVLDHAVARMLFERFPELDEGALTQMRAYLVRSESLARQGAELGLGEAAEVGRSEDGFRARKALLEDLFEAVIGAIEQDGGWEAARAFVERQLGPIVETLQPGSAVLVDPKSALQEAAQARGLPLPVYREIAAGGEDHRRFWRFEVLWKGEPIAEGEGRTKKAAQREAARRALQRLGLGGHTGPNQS